MNHQKTTAVQRATMKKNTSSTAARKSNTSGKRTTRSVQAKQEPQARKPTIPASLVNWSAGKPMRYIRVSDSRRPEEDHHEIERDLRKQANLGTARGNIQSDSLNPMAFRTPLLNTIFTGKPIVRLRRMSLRPIG